MMKNTERLLGLDVARGLAACLVVLSHVVALSWVPWGQVPGTPIERFVFALGSPSVDLFFVLSGYVIARACVAPPMPWLNYVRWRLIRLLPVAWCGVLLGCLARWLINMDNPATGVLWQHLQLPVVGMDWLAFFSLTVPLNVDFIKINIALWSLQVEMLFVIVFPLLLMALRQLSWFALVLIWVLCVIFALVLSSSVFLYLPLFALGMLVAMHPPRIFHGSKYALLGVLVGLGWMCLTNLGVELLQSEIGTGFLKRYLDMWGAATVVLSLARWQVQPPFVLRVLGQISYSLYVVHVPIMMLVAWAVHVFLGWSYWLGGLLSIPVALLFAYVLYYFFERKMIFWSRQYRSIHGHTFTKVTQS
jgi:peptidoglycan/LPS O-acetylase OafA/YrhL